MKAVSINQHGSSKVLQCIDIPIPSILSAEVLIEVKATGVNFKDIYDRKGIYPISLPHILGIEGTGVVVAKGEDVLDFELGDRVGFAFIHGGAYAEYVAVQADKVVKLPPKIDFSTGAACLLQGLTAHFLTHETFPLHQGHTVLIHAAAGGVGFLAVQLAKFLGATVIGTVSTETKAQLAKEAGVDLVIRYDHEDFAHKVMEYTDGKGVDVVYDSVGATTFNSSLNSLKSRGLMVLYGQSSGLVPPLDLNMGLGRLDRERGSFFITRPIIGHYLSDRVAYQDSTSRLFNYIQTGQLKLRIGDLYPLERAYLAHKALEDRSDRGKFLLIPES
jgi:NADPH2:quinone reductase